MGRGMKLKKKEKEREKIKNSYCSKSISFENQQGNTQNHETSCLLRSWLLVDGGDWASRPWLHLHLHLHFTVSSSSRYYILFHFRRFRPQSNHHNNKCIGFNDSSRWSLSLTISREGGETKRSKGMRKLRVRLVTIEFTFITRGCAKLLPLNPFKLTALRYYTGKESKV